jgi:hypothetical protein
VTGVTFPLSEIGTGDEVEFSAERRQCGDGRSFRRSKAKVCNVP